MNTKTRPINSTPVAEPTRMSALYYFRFLMVGCFFGFVLVKAEVVSWYRIQEMFRFHSFHMFGVIGSAIIVSMLSLYLLRRFSNRSLTGERFTVQRYPTTYFRYAIGGSIFGIGWALTGACPGPILALIGGGMTAFLIVFAAAILGTWAYGWLKPKLPH